ncbi:ribonuclease E/G [Hellea sp.]|nr:ribonuclease E/G [Hellea sp.]
MKRRCVIEYCIGETRAAIYENKKLVELHLRRFSNDLDPYVGDIFIGKVSKIDQSIGGAFVDLGGGLSGLLKFSNASGSPRFTEGYYAKFVVTKASDLFKSPLVSFVKKIEKSELGKISGDDLKGYLSKRFSDLEFTEASVSILDDATDTELAIDGGGSISIEQTRALVAIDVDKGSAISSYDVCQKAIPMLAREIRLRGLGGLLVIDLPNLRQPKQRNAIFKLAEKVFSSDPNNVKLAPLSRFGVLELTRNKVTISLCELLNDKHGNPTVETMALGAIRQLVREGVSNPGARLTLTVPSLIMNWMNSCVFDWKNMLNDRIGPRYIVTEGEYIDIRADR